MLCYRKNVADARLSSVLKARAVSILQGLLISCNQMSAEYLFMTDKLYDVRYDTGDKVIQCGRHNDIFKLWLQWRAKVQNPSHCYRKPILCFLITHRVGILFSNIDCTSTVIFKMRNESFILLLGNRRFREAHGSADGTVGIHG